MDDEGSEEPLEASPAEKLAIAKHFIMHSPNGEVDAVMKDMKVLVGTDLLTPAWEMDVRAKYSKRQLIPSGKGDAQVLVSNYSEKEPGKFLNPNSLKLVPVDFKTLEAGEAEEGKVADEPTEGLRAACQKALDGYIQSNFMDNKGLGVVYAKEGKLDVVISMKNLNLANYWTGGWRSEYNIDVSDADIKITGKVRLNVHYFEEGNVQLNSDFQPEAIPISLSGDEGKDGKAIVDTISKLETDFHGKFEQFYVDMHDNLFKGMRRILPKTAKKFDWNTATHAVASEMGEAKS